VARASRSRGRRATQRDACARACRRARSTGPPQPLLVVRVPPRSRRARRHSAARRLCLPDPRSASAQSGLENSQRMLETKLEELKKKLEDEAFH
jgi:hypothetical protein